MKTPFVTLQQIQDIVQTYPTPFHIYDEQGIRANARRLKAAFSWNQGFREYFAVKATPNPYIMEILKEEGVGADCSSLTELMLADAVGLDGEQIMFSSNETPPGEFKRCNELGGTINLDDETLLEQLQSECGVPGTVCCRYNPGGVMSVSNTIMDNPGDAKYGMTKAQLFATLGKLKKLGVKRLGVHAFLCSNTKTNEYYPALAKVLFALAVEIKSQLGISLSFINMSGGVGIPYSPGDQACDILTIGALVKKVYEEMLIPHGLDDIALYTELGRFMLAPYGHLVTRAIHEKHIYKEYIGVDACAVNLMRPAMYGAYHHITVLGKEDAACDRIYDVVGSLCENNDKFAVDRELPRIDMGDYLVIHDTGAHGFSMGYNYNGKLRSAELLLQADGTVRQIRRAETPADYFATIAGYPGIVDSRVMSS